MEQINTKEDEEYESKILEITADDYRNIILENIGTIEKPKIPMTAVWVQNPETGHKVRIREEGTKVVIEEKKEIFTEDEGVKGATEKKYLNKGKSFEEELILWQNEGYITLNKSVKTRISFILENGVKVEFDKYSYLDGMEIPEFAEIEGPSYETIVETAEMMGFTKDDLKDWNAGELAAYYKEKNRN